uniref:Uncharacterized protein n=1 Tax=Cacopsylla melanoneura TaxID=428564 RepID=A0A8D8TUS3_9HEMI
MFAYFSTNFDFSVSADLIVSCVIPVFNNILCLMNLHVSKSAYIFSKNCVYVVDMIVQREVVIPEWDLHEVNRTFLIFFEDSINCRLDFLHGRLLYIVATCY